MHKIKSMHVRTHNNGRLGTDCFDPFPCPMSKRLLVRTIWITDLVTHIGLGRICFEKYDRPKHVFWT
jgi:hypothetical protein